MSLQSQLTLAFTAVGTEVKAVHNKVGQLSSLTTTDKSSTVSAINELKNSLTSAAGINDTTPSTTSTYSSSKTNTLLALKADLASPTFTGTVSGITKSMVGLSNVDNTADTAKPVSTVQQTALDLKAPLASPTFTGTVSGVTKSMVGLGSVDNTADTAKPVSTAQQTALNLKLDLTGGTLSGGLVLQSGFTQSSVPRTAAATMNTSSPTQNLCDATTASFTITLPNTTIAGIIFYFKKTDATANTVTISGTIDGTSTYVLTAAQQSVTIVSTPVSGAWRIVGATQDKAQAGLSNVDNTSDANKPVSSATTTALNLKAPLASPTFTGTVAGITKTMVGLANVDNTADTAKPVSTAQQTALDLKAPLASPTFTGTVSGVTKTMVGLANVDNTADTAKPVSTAQATAIAALIADASATSATTTTYSANKINAAISAATSALVNGSPAALDTLNELAAALGNDANYATTTSTAIGNRVRYDAVQTLTSPQMLQARQNIDAAGLSTDIGNVAYDFVAAFNAALV